MSVQQTTISPSVPTHPFDSGAIDYQFVSMRLDSVYIDEIIYAGFTCTGHVFLVDLTHGKNIPFVYFRSTTRVVVEDDGDCSEVTHVDSLFKPDMVRRGLSETRRASENGKTMCYWRKVRRQAPQAPPRSSHDNNPQKPDEDFQGDFVWWPVEKEIRGVPCSGRGPNLVEEDSSWVDTGHRFVGNMVHGPFTFTYLRKPVGEPLRKNKRYRMRDDDDTERDDDGDNSKHRLKLLRNCSQDDDSAADLQLLGMHAEEVQTLRRQQSTLRHEATVGEDHDSGDQDDEFPQGDASDLCDENIVFQFYSKSTNVPRPGEGSGEKIPPEDELKFGELATISEWRRKLSNFWCAPFDLDGHRWTSVEHYYQASKFKKNNPHFFLQFTLDANPQGELAKDPVLAKAAGGKTGKFKGKQVREEEIVIDPDFFNGRHESEMKAAQMAKFSQNAELREMLLATRKAKLQHFVRASPPVVFMELMEVRKELSRN